MHPRSRQVTRGIHTDCLLNYETVKYFGGEQHEGERYRDAIRQYQAMEYKVIGMLDQKYLHDFGFTVILSSVPQPA